MKTLFTILLSIFFTATAYSRIITVDNNYPSAGMFTNIQDAHDAANPGDTIYVYPSLSSYEGIEINKKLTIVGNGFNRNNFDFKATFLNGSIKFNEKANGSSLLSFGGEFSLEIKSDDVTIARNKLSKITITDNANNICILQNFIIGESRNGYKIVLGDKSNGIIKNNIIYNKNFYATWDGIAIPNNKFVPNFEIYNNVLIGNEPIGVPISCSFFNNIIYGMVCGGSFCFNIFINHQWDIWPLVDCGNNMILSSSIDVFYPDFKLKPDSPAKGYGKNGEDCGIYGGDIPFVDGGYPDIPFIYELEAGQTGYKDSGLKVKIKARANR